MGAKKVKEYISTEKAGKEIDRTPRTIQQLCKEEKIKHKKFGRYYLIDREDWEEWKARHITAA